ncbi:MAG TPA: hypothetical protein VI815_03205 [Candidatus Nanoarchaeia archaeon]|nr:hypothetical protein [Candidatus Nanoarchaeia archaeon]
MNKRGQFYIIAAVVIIVALFGIAAVTNYVVTKPNQIRQVELSKQLNLESESVINYGIFNGSDLDPLLFNFTSQYAEYLSSETENDIYFVYGDHKNIYYYAYQRNSTGGVDLTLGGSPINIPIQGNVASKNITEITGEVIKITVAGKDYEFKLNQGQNFFFLIRSPQNE